MSIAIDHQVGAAALNNPTTSTIDTTAGSLLIGAECGFIVSSPGVISSSPATTWTQVSPSFGEAGLAQVTLWYAKNPTTNAAQSCIDTGSLVAACLFFADFTGVDLSSPFDTANGTGTVPSASTSYQVPAITLSADNQLVVSAITLNADEDNSSLAIDSGFTIVNKIPYVGGDHNAGGMAYKVFGGGTSGSTVQPTWSWTNSVRVAAGQMSFLAATAGATSWGALLSDQLNRIVQGN